MTKITLRLDKYLADMGFGTRTEIKNMVRKGMVSVNGAPVKTPEMKINITTDNICVNQRPVTYVTQEYYMLNKPKGVLSATEDKKAVTVLDLIETRQRKDLFPVGRLDKDTEGLLLITNDGDLAHRLLSPKKHVAKLYEATVDGRVTKQDADAFKAGLEIDQGFRALPAELEILESGLTSKVRIIIYEGKFHQIKRMFEAVDKEVLTLKRLSMGPLVLDESLEPGDYRPLSEAELTQLKNSCL